MVARRRRQVLAVAVVVVAVAGGAAWRAWPGSPSAKPTVTTPTTGPSTVAAPTTTTAPRSSPVIKIGYAEGRDRRLVEQAIARLRSHRALAYQRDREIVRLQLRPITELRISPCSNCAPRIFGRSFAENPGSTAPAGCTIKLYLPLARRVAANLGISAAAQVASTIIHEQEHCLYTPDRRETHALDAELRFAPKLGGAPLVGFIKAHYKFLTPDGYWKQSLPGG